VRAFPWDWPLAGSRFARDGGAVLSCFSGAAGRGTAKKRKNHKNKKDMENALKRDSMVFYRSFHEAIRDLPTAGERDGVHRAAPRHAGQKRARI